MCIRDSTLAVKASAPTVYNDTHVYCCLCWTIALRRCWNVGVFLVHRWLSFSGFVLSDVPHGIAGYATWRALTKRRRVGWRRCRKSPLKSKFLKVSILVPWEFQSSGRPICFSLLLAIVASTTKLLHESIQLPLRLCHPKCSLPD